MAPKFTGSTLATILTGLLLSAVGCGPKAGMVHVGTPPEFWQEVRDEPRPVVAVFCKEGCPACAMQEGTMIELVGEYEGRVKFIRAERGEAEPSGLLDECHIRLYPTVLVLVKGHEKARFRGGDGEGPVRGCHREGPEGTAAAYARLADGSKRQGRSSAAADRQSRALGSLP